MTITLVTGTRPEIIKLYPLMRILHLKGVDYKFIHTGQHYDRGLFLKFIEEFGIRPPDYNIKLLSFEPLEQISEMMTKLGDIFKRLSPSLVIVQGDTNSVLASALTAVKHCIPVAHLESGLRCDDWRMAEEHNRRVVDHISDILFATTKESADNLKNEKVHGEVYLVGNTVLDAITMCLVQSSTSINDTSDNNNQYCFETGLNSDLHIRTEFGKSGFVLVTMHRSENVDDPNFLKQFFMALSLSGLDYVFPIHPRTLKRIKEFNLERIVGKTIKIIQPTGYQDFLRLLSTCKFVITDSGGVQEEITSPIINKHALVMRSHTERYESIWSGHAILCRGPYDHRAILKGINEILSSLDKHNVCPYPPGNAAEKIFKILESKFALTARIRNA
jgi:UDP-N-acetylglucosamine 2-epimerase (non-hydrolysing)